MQETFVDSDTTHFFKYFRLYNNNWLSEYIILSHFQNNKLCANIVCPIMPPSLVFTNHKFDPEYKLYVKLTYTKLDKSNFVVNVQFIKQILDILIFLYNHSISHNDINIYNLLTSYGNPFLIDFEFAKIYKQNNDIKNFGVLVYNLVTNSKIALSKDISWSTFKDKCPAEDRELLWKVITISLFTNSLADIQDLFTNTIKINRKFLPSKKEIIFRLNGLGFDKYAEIIATALEESSQFCIEDEEFYIIKKLLEIDIMNILYT